jgi:hypothetical protein
LTFYKHRFPSGKCRIFTKKLTQILSETYANGAF